MHAKVESLYLDIPTLHSTYKQTNSKPPQNQTTTAEKARHPTLTGNFNLLMVCHKLVNTFHLLPVYVTALF